MDPGNDPWHGVKRARACLVDDPWAVAEGALDDPWYEVL